MSDSLLSSSVGLIGDIAMAFGDYIGPQLINYCSSENIQVTIKIKNDVFNYYFLVSFNDWFCIKTGQNETSCNMDSKTIEKNSEECEWPLGGRTLSNLELTCTSDLV